MNFHLSNLEKTFLRVSNYTDLKNAVRMSYELNYTLEQYKVKRSKLK